MKKRIAVFGAGYVGLSVSVLLALFNEVVIVDILKDKVDKINQGKQIIRDEYIERYMRKKSLDLTATMDGEKAIRDSEYILIATPTDYDSDKEFFNTSSAEEVIYKAYSANPWATIVIKSTVPVGFSVELKKKYPGIRLLFCPEFLREGNALYDNLYPSRIIVGTDLDDTVLVGLANEFADLLKEAACNKPEVRIMGYTEAEAVKLFANTYLALRVSFFNELDTYAEEKGLDSKSIIEGVGLDPRIGAHYNNPSFGYGGYCLPKDTRQLLANYKDIPEDLIHAIVDSNQTRKEYIAKKVLQKVIECHNKDGDDTIGIFRLTMKKASDNYRQSSIQGVIRLLKKQNVEIIIFEPTFCGDYFYGCKIINNLNEFKKNATVIVANRYDTCLDDVKEKVYTRDLFFVD